MRRYISLIIAITAMVTLILARDARQAETVHELYQQLASRSDCDTVSDNGVTITTSIAVANSLATTMDTRDVYFVDASGTVSQVLEDGHWLTIVGSENW